MIIELTEKQARETAWCLLASIETALKLGLGDLVSERLELVHLLAPAQAEAHDATPASTSPWLDPTHQKEIIHAVENMIRFLRTQSLQRERLCTYEELLRLITASQKETEEPHQEHDQ